MGFFVAVLADKNDSISLLCTSPINRNNFRIHFEIVKRVTTIRGYHGETQGSCDFVTNASPCGTVYFQSCLVCDGAILNSVVRFLEGKAFLFLFSFLPEVFLCIRCFPRATARTE